MPTFLAKTEPSEYSIDDLAREGRTVWSGVRNPVAVRTIRSMHPGDRVLIYHSGPKPAIVGLARVINEPEIDPHDPKSWTVELKYLNHFTRPVTLKEIKESEAFDDWALVRQGRLSTMLVPEHFLVWMINYLDQGEVGAWLAGSEN